MSLFLSVYSNPKKDQVPGLCTSNSRALFNRQCSSKGAIIFTGKGPVKIPFWVIRSNTKSIKCDFHAGFYCLSDPQVSEGKMNAMIFTTHTYPDISM